MTTAAQVQAGALAQTSIYLPTLARIAAVRDLTEYEKLYTLDLPGDYTLDHRPGQFVEVSVLGIGEAPISITSSPSRSNGTFELCIRRAGTVTNAIHRLKQLSGQPGRTHLAIPHLSGFEN